ERVEAHALHPLERAAEDVARVAFVRLAVRRDDVADHPRDLRLALLPRHQLKGLGIRNRDHVGLLDRVEARDRRAVEAHPIVESALDLVRGDREALQVAFDVREPEEDELDALLLHPLEDVLARVLARRRPVPALDLRHERLLENAKSPGRALPRPRLRRLKRRAGVYTAAQ